MVGYRRGEKKGLGASEGEVERGEKKGLGTSKG
jgi:hypothetical protein